MKAYLGNVGVDRTTRSMHLECDQKVLRLKGVETHYRIAGVGPPLVLLHGWGASASAMLVLEQGLATSFKVLNLDFPGHGQSSSPEEAWAVDDYLDHLLSLLESEDIQRPIVVCHSFGARVAIKLAATLPGGVKCLVIIAGAGLPGRRTVGYLARRSVAFFGKHFAEGLPGQVGTRLKKWLYSKVASKDYLEAGPLRDTFVRVVSEDLSKHLPEITQPVLLLWGEQDEATPVEAARKMKSAIPDSRLVILPGAGHYVFSDRPQRTLMEIHRFIRQHI